MKTLVNARRLALFGATLLLVTAARDARAWDTLTYKKASQSWPHPTGSDEEWKSTYLSGTHHGNEHVNMTERILSELGVEDRFGNDAQTGSVVIVKDLNSALFNPSLAPAMNGVSPPDPLEDPYDFISTAIEERTVPPVAQFAGLADYSYNFPDWIYKNTQCSVLPAGAPFADRCHEFRGWMGALNANHFGTQARDTYLRLHGTALALADRAAQVLQTLGATPATRQAYEEYIREAQVEAMAFESHAQHFLQDRWSVGHMFERWSAADYAFIQGYMATRSGASVSGLQVFQRSIEAAVVAGLLHGSEGVVGIPDAMCSPAYDVISGTHRPATWRTANGSTPLDGVGDYRYEDGLSGTYASEPLDVIAQYSQMHRCSRQGYLEVLNRFADPTLAINSVVAEPQLTDPNGPCWNAWATNSAIADGWAGPIEALGTVARTSPHVTLAFDGSPAGYFDNRHTWVQLGMTIAWAALQRPNGVDLARGSTMPHLHDVPPGNRFTLPSYMEPVDLTQLGWDDNGRAQSFTTVAAFFNRAHTDTWCERSEMLADLRGSPDIVHIDACVELADRFYRGTAEAYRGARQEHRRAIQIDQVEQLAYPSSSLAPGYTLGQPVEPVCELYAAVSSQDPERVPTELHPGYVAYPEQISILSETYTSMENWCRRVPVLHGLWHPQSPQAALRFVYSDDASHDVVAVADEVQNTPVLKGANLGTGGEIMILRNGHLQTLSTTSWSPDRIGLDLSGEQLPPGDYPIRVRRTDGTESVGLFLLRLEDTIREPVILSVDVDGQIVPGGTVGIEVYVFDYEGVLDLTGPNAAVELVSPILQGGRHTLVGAIPTGSYEAVFGNAAVPLADVINDRSSCAPPEHLMVATAIDSNTFPLQQPVALVGPDFLTTHLATNVRPEVPQTSIASTPVVRVKPGRAFQLEVRIEDDNDDGNLLCQELLASGVGIVAEVSGLTTAPVLTSLQFTRTGGAFVPNGAAQFLATVALAKPHPDRATPFPVRYMATDDAGLPLAAPGTIHVVVENVAPAVVGVHVGPASLHPDSSNFVYVEATVSDDNGANDVVQVTADLSLIGGDPVTLLTPGLGTGRWFTLAEVHTPVAAGLYLIFVQAMDDNGETSLARRYLVTVANDPPVFSGGGFGYAFFGSFYQQQAALTECNAVDLGAVFIDPNDDTLSVHALISGPGFYREVAMNKTAPSGHNWHARVGDLCEGEYEIRYRARETHTLDQYTTISGPFPLTVVNAPARCAVCDPPVFIWPF